tara:strand:- start:371 stop:577 length:207 start_codon:yes stop_codon:yes gene_type:complete
MNFCKPLLSCITALSLLALSGCATHDDDHRHHGGRTTTTTTEETTLSTPYARAPVSTTVETHTTRSGY